MPHFIVEYSANLERAVNIKGLVTTIHRAAIETEIFPLKGTRTRAARQDIYEIADGHVDNSFIHVCAKIGQGRAVEIRQRAGEAIFGAVCDYLRPYFESNPLALSFEMQEIEPATSFKTNNLPQWIEGRQAK
jgi:5-carboxymethyl-2-hydroxymuconate isomerase